METLKSNELRIGNWVEVINSNGVETTIQPSSFSVDIETHYKAIPLNEEWLKRFRFEFKGKRISYKWFYLWNHEGRIVFALAEMHEEIGVYLEVHSVHQLQNLFFSLTGEELTIK